MVLFFFFQAEDGIRDLTVTGVQTCALPIFRRIGRELNVRYALEGSVRRAGSALRITAQLIDVETEEHLWAEKYSGKIGRASCRERGVDLGGRRIIKKKKKVE